MAGGDASFRTRSASLAITVYGVVISLIWIVTAVSASRASDRAAALVAIVIWVGLTARMRARTGVSLSANELVVPGIFTTRRWRLSDLRGLYIQVGAVGLYQRRYLVVVVDREIPLKAINERVGAAPSGLEHFVELVRLRAASA